MDNTDCWISEFDFKSLTLPSSTDFASPGPSSGYCSSEESYNQLKAINGSHDSKNLISNQRQSESFRHADAFNGAFGLDLANDLIGMEDNSFDFGASPPNIDDLMDTFWNPIKLEFPSMDSLSDFDMADMSQSPGVLGATGCRSDPGSTRLANIATTAQRYSSSPKPGWQKRSASPSKEEPSLVKKPSNPSLSSGNTISAESRNRLKRVFDFQQQVAGLADMMVGDEEEYVMQFSPSSNNKVASRVAESAGTRPSAVTAIPPTQGSSALLGVFSQRGTVPVSFKNCETKALTRVRGGAVASSCGTLLRHSVSLPSNVKSDGAHRNAGTRSQNSGTAQHSCSRGDMKGGRVNASVLALDDHRYTLRPSHSPPVQRSSRGRKANATAASNPAASTQNAPYSGKMSILEAFLRSTRPLDPNKGSNAALAAEGLAHLRIEADDESSGTILKKLLTGEIDQSEVHRCEQQVIQERASTCSAALAAAEPLLADDFGLGAELLLGGSDANGLLCDDLVSGGGLWMNAEGGDEAFSSELDEIRREQTRQDDLWLRHYINCL